MIGHMKLDSRLLAFTVVVAVILSAWWRIPYVFTSSRQRRWLWRATW